MKKSSTREIRQLLWLGAALLFFLPACAQTKSGLYKTQAFYAIKLPGTAMADENGQPIQPTPRIERLLYIEISAKDEPKVAVIKYNGVPYGASLFLEDKLPVSIGVLKLTGKTMVWQPKKGNRIWRIEVGEPLNGSASIQPKEVKRIEIRGNAGAKPFTNILTKEMEIKSLDAY